MNISSVLPNLENFEVSENCLKGHIPSKTWGMKHLRALNLSNNQLLGEISIKFFVPPSLVQLHLSGNKFIDKIPKKKFPLIWSRSRSTKIFFWHDSSMDGSKSFNTFYAL